MRFSDTRQAGKAESKAPIIVTLIIIAVAGVIGYVEGLPHYRETIVEREIQSILNIDAFKSESRERGPDQLENEIKSFIKETFGPKTKVAVKVEPIPNESFKYRAAVKYRYEKSYPFQDPKPITVQAKYRSQQQGQR